MNTATQLFFEGNKVKTFFNKKGTSCEPIKTEYHTEERNGTIQKVSFDKHRKKFVLNVKTQNGFFLCEQENVTQSNKSYI